MYRPNRVGPFGLVTLESEPFVTDEATRFGTSNLNAVPLVNVRDSTPNRETDSVTWVYTDDLNLGTTDHGGFGVKIVGDRVFDENEYILSYSGSFRGFSSAESVSVKAVVGRASSIGIIQFSLFQFAYVPMMHYSHIRTQGAELSQISCECNGSVILGNWRPELAELEDPAELFFGFVMANGDSVGEAVFSNVQASMSIHRYESDLRPFDPNR